MSLLLDITQRYSLSDANVGRVMTVAEHYLRDCASPCSSGEACRTAVVVTALNSLPTHYYVDAFRQDTAGSPWVLVEQAVADAVEQTCCRPDSRQPDTAG
jgi:hypothetical protein